MMMQRPPEPILHVDMDAFYAAVESRDDPALAGVPVLVGGAGGRGVVASASYEARDYGIRSAMPMARARRLCPHAVVRPPRFDAYRQVSAQLLDLFRSVTPLVEPLSLDEAFLDVGGAVRLLGEPAQIGSHLRARIHAELGLRASVGVAPNKFLAKLCSGKAKPDGQLHLRAAEVDAYLLRLSVRDLWGVGEQTAAALDRFGLRTVADVRAVTETSLARIVGDAAAGQIHRLSRGQDARPVSPYEPAKGMSAEETFDRDIADPDLLRTEVLRLAEKVARRLRRGDVAARTVSLRLRYADFTTISRSRTLAVPTDQATAVHREVTALLDALRLKGAGVRLIGVRASNLVPSGAARQLDLLGDDRWSRLERAADVARTWFGEAALTRGALLDDDAPRSGDAAAAAEDWRSRREGEERPVSGAD
ncbi:MAG: DNA polymerase IV [Egibacteraceae bacterium]